MPDLFDHVLLTRFNLSSEGVESTIRARRGWLEHRVAMFEQYCLPSVRGQHCGDFDWLIYFDINSPDWLRRRMQPHVDAGAFTAKWVTSLSTSDLLADLRSVVANPAGQIMTTNLDNDDALASDFVTRLHSVVPQAGPQAIFINEGLARRSERLYAIHDPVNAFCTVLEPWARAETCWVDWHTLLPERMATVTLTGRPGWLQTIHDTNVSNRVRGRLVAPDTVADLFDGLGQLPRPTPGAMVWDGLISVPARAVRDGARTWIKNVVLRTIGKRGLERIKLALARHA